MNWLRGFFFLLMSLAVGLVWMTYLYLNSNQNLAAVREELQVKKQQEMEHPPENISLIQTTKAFCEELYGQNRDQEKLASYTTEKGKGIFIPPGDEKKPAAIEVKMTVEGVNVYMGTADEQTAEVIAAIKRTTSINGATATSTSYILLHMVEIQDKWLVDNGTFLGEITNEN